MPSADTIYTVLAILVPAVEMLGILTAVHAIMNARTSQSAIAWAISLVTFPWLAIALYAVFGRNKFKGYVFLRSAKNVDIHHFKAGVRSEASAKEFSKNNLLESEKAMTRLADMPITRFNSSRLLVDGPQTFDSIFKAIESSGDYILIQYYIVKDDGLGQKLKSALIQKAKQNVRIYFLYDEIGSHDLPRSYIRELQGAGVVTSAFHTTKGRANRFQLNFRNHRKIVVVDGKTAFVGGNNVGDEYLSGHQRFGPWRDTHVRLEGPVVQAIQFCFVEDWYWATGEIPPMNWHLEKAPDGGEEALVIASGPADPLETCGLMFVHAINSARQRIWIASPYFVPDLQILTALKLAAMNDVDVRILLPEKADHRTVHLASFSYYLNTLPFGVKLFRYSAGFMHQKVFLVDSFCAAVGTANLDNRSFRLNFEITVLNFDPGFVEKVENMLEKDFSLSRPVELSEYTQQSFPFRFAVRSARLLAPIL